MPRYAAVLFDLDGTLIDSIGLIVDSFHHTLAAVGLPRRSDEDWIRGIGTPLRGQLAPFARDEADLDALVATYREYNMAHHVTDGSIADIDTWLKARLSSGDWRNGRA